MSHNHDVLAKTTFCLILKWKLGWTREYEGTVVTEKYEASEENTGVQPQY